MASSPSTDHKTRWEYTARIVNHPLGMDFEVLAKLGEDGWEAVCVLQSLTMAGEHLTNRVLFKRPIHDEAMACVPDDVRARLGERS